MTYIKCEHDKKGCCKLKIANKCKYNKRFDCCIITDFTDFLLMKMLKLIKEYKDLIK